ncbi:hypothetical protein RKD23_000014 [Streptomyces sp. SAI-170]|uniref:hypothetical protein n=1 Tax=Streptomyces sp. SAI-170 TaxID=3377729 RepID=UPI003C7D1F37
MTRRLMREEVMWTGQLGKKSAELRRTGDRSVLTIGHRQAIIRSEARIWHLSGVRPRIIIEHADEPSFIYRYRLSWVGIYALFLEACYDEWSALADDPGLDLVDHLGGYTDWRNPWDPIPPKPRAYRSARRWRRRYGKPGSNRSHS